MKKFVIAAALVAFGATVAYADAIADRQALMKGIAGSTKEIFAVVKGEKPFDAAEVKKHLQVYVDDAAKFTALFPDDSKTGGDTTASPKIWEDMEGFKAEMAKFSADATAAMSATDVASLGAAMKTVTGHCQTCHEAYRVKKS